jgi:VanZ family protein
MQMPDRTASALPTERTHMRYTWTPLLVWIAVIVLESSSGSSANTGSILRPLFQALFGEVDFSRFETVHHLARKGGHFLGFGILGLLWFRAFFRTMRAHTLRASAALALVCATAVAALDEWHQSFQPDRGGSLADVALDAFGAAAFIAVALIFVARRRRLSPAFGG